MGYLSLDSGVPDFTQCIISFWVRVPKFSVNDCYNAYEPGVGRFDQAPPLNGIIPLVVMGKQGQGQAPFQDIESDTFWATACGYIESQTNTVVTTTIEHTANRIVNQQVGKATCQFSHSCSDIYQHRFLHKTTQTGPVPVTDPTFIGLDCSGGPNNGPWLYLNFETAQKPSIAHTGYEVQSVTPGFQDGGCGSIGGVQVGCPQTPGPCASCAEAGRTYILVLQGVGQAVTLTEDYCNWVDCPDCDVRATAPHQNYVDNSYFYTSTGAIYSDSAGPVTPEVWHHVLVSLDLKTIRTSGYDDTTGEPRNFVDHFQSWSDLYLALDDQNQTMDQVGGDWFPNPDLNALVTDDAYEVADTFSSLNFQYNDTPPGGSYEDAMPLPSYVLSNPVIPAGGSPIGIPATPQFVDNIFDVDYAEFQMWVGQKIDTGDVNMRRLFVKENGTPEDPSVAEHVLGAPLIRFHGTKKWILGENTGSLSNEGKASPTGDFTPEGTIIYFKPDPALTGAPVKPENPKSKG